ncbi:MAG TPA: serine protease [Candidatus Acidoferrum sp.]|nr:serine protease [Candidatus Acidoferrum sp.]
MFPKIIGTGFVVDRDGIVVTNDHVIEALQQLPCHPISKVPSGIAIVWGSTEPAPGGYVFPIHFVEIKSYSRIASFGANGPYYGEDRPDIGFVQLKVREVPALPLVTASNVLRQGLDVAIAGFPRGTEPMVAYGKVSQLTPLLRRGIVSSLLPFPCPQPHGFTIDIMSQGGASGSPVFLADSPEVVGLVHAGFDGTNLTYAVPSIMIRDALDVCTAGAGLDLSDVPTLQDLARQAERSDELRWDSFLQRMPDTGAVR